MSIGETIRDNLDKTHSFGLGADLSLGRILGQYSQWNLKAHSDALGTSLQSISGPFTGTLSQPSEAVAIGVASTSTDDTSDGSGARTVRLTGLDDDYAVQTADVTLTGQTKATTGSTLFRSVHDVQVLTAGAGGVNAGVIYLADASDTFTNGVPTTPFGLVETAWNRSSIPDYLVPDGYELGLAQLQISADNAKTCVIVLEILNGAGLWERRFELHVGSGFAPMSLSEPVLPARERVRVRGYMELTSGSVSVDLSGVLRRTT